MAIATWFGCGYFPWAPGTIGSLAGLVIYVVLHIWLGAGRWTLVLLTAMLTPIGIWAATRAARVVQRKDPGLVVVDEVLGQWVTLLGGTAHNAVLRAHGMRPARAPFRHGAIHDLPAGKLLADSYHVSRLNTNTGRLTEAMFHAVVEALLGRLAMLQP